MNVKTVKFQLNIDGSTPYLSDIIGTFPSNVILNKCVPGLGATTLELITPRNSIVVTPPRTVIEGKCNSEFHSKDHLFGVYKGVASEEVAFHIRECLDKKWDIKIMTTPESLRKVIKAIEECGLNYRKDFFWLLDEMHKFATDVDYRPNILSPFKVFFESERKALVSATPIPLSDPRFEEQGFTLLNVVPDFDYSQPVKVVGTNAVIPVLREELEASKNEDTVWMIFLNSTDECYEIIRQFDIAEESAVFCSQESVDKLRNSVGFKHAYPLFTNKRMRKINFFTSRYFTAFDINLDFKPNVVMFTDVVNAPHTMIDPYTDAVQIVGRFRNGVDKIIHITNFIPHMKVKTPNEVHDYITACQSVYDTIRGLRDAEDNPVVREALSEACEALPFKKYLFEDGSVNHFLIDCLKHDHSVRQLYTGFDSLWSAYERLPHFTVDGRKRLFPISDDARAKITRLSITTHERQKAIVELLDNLGESAMDVEVQRDLNLIDPFIVSAYRTLGREKIEQLRYSRRKIQNMMTAMQFRNQFTSPLVVRQICSHFNEGCWYPASAIKAAITSIFKESGIRSCRKVCGKMITEYFDAKEERQYHEGERQRGYMLISRKFEID